jgi:glutathione S-transferase
MLTLYHCHDARSFRTLWTMEELGLEYRLVLLPFPPRVFAKPYLAINPLGTIPLLVDGDVRMTESAATCEYLVSKYGPTPLAVSVDDPAFGAFLNWVHFGEATLTFPQTLVLRYGRLEPPERRNPQIVEDYSRWFLGRLRAVDTTVARSSYLCADRFTIADVSVGYALLLAADLGLGARFSPAIAAYWEGLQQRPPYVRARLAQEVAETNLSE